MLASELTLTRPRGSYRLRRFRRCGERTLVPSVYENSCERDRVELLDRQELRNAVHVARGKGFG